MTCPAWSFGLVAALLVATLPACPPPMPSPSPPAPPVPTPASSPTSATAAPPPAPVVEPEDAILSLAAYRPRLERLLGERARLLPSSLDAGSRPPIGHAVVTLHHRDMADGVGRSPFYMITVGLGRRSQPHVFGTTPRFVELVAQTHRDDDAVREALSSLGQYLHAADRPISVRFQAFDTIRLDEPIFGERFFALVPSDLVPEGRLAVVDELSVLLLQVIPMEERDFIHMNMRGDGAVRTWWSRHRGTSELLHRWDGVMGHGVMGNDVMEASVTGNGVTGNGVTENGVMSRRD